MRPGRLLAALSAAFLGVTLLPAQASAFPDVTPPVIRFQIPESDGTGPWAGWYRDPVTFEVSASDPGGSGVVRISFRHTGAQTGEGSAGDERIGTTISAEGVTTVEVTATDAEGNVASLTYGIGVDLSGPTATASGVAHNERLRGSERRVLTFSCGDAGGAIVNCTATNDGAPFTSGSPLATSTLGPHTVVVRAVDRVGRQQVTTIPYRVAGPLTVLTLPGVAGSPTIARPGTTLRGTEGTFSPAADSWNFRWYADGTLVGTGTTYLVQLGDVGKTISMDVLALHPDHLDTVTAKVGSVEVLSLDFAVTAAPAVSGSGKVGARLTLTDGVVTPQTAPAETRWRVDGAVVGGGSPLLLTRDHSGKRISCDQVFVRAGYARTAVPCVFPGGADGITVTASTPPWKVVEATRVAGKAKVGKRLRAVLPRLSAPAATHRYQWLRNGKAIKNATAATYRVTKRDRGKAITLRVTSTAQGQPTLTSVSAPRRVRR